MTEAAAGEPIAPAQPSPTVPGILRALLQADFTVQVRNGRSLLLTFVLPLVLLYAIAVAKRGPQLGAPIFRVALALTLGIISIAILGYTYSIARDRESGVFQRLRVTPAPPWTIMGSRLTVQVAAVVLMTALTLVGAAIVMNVTLSPGAYLLTILCAVFSSAVFLGVGQALVGFVVSPNTINAVGRLLYLPLFALGLFGHSTIFGTTFETIARWSPGGVVSDLLTGAMEPSTWSTQTWWALLACAGYAIVFTAIGIRWFRWTGR